MGGDEMEREEGHSSENNSNVNREKPEVSDERAALIKKLTERTRSGRNFHQKSFERMSYCMDLSDGKQWSQFSAYGFTTEDDYRYTANLIQRHIHQRTSALYAKNPTVVATRRRRRLYKLWSGDMNEIMQAQMTIQAATMGGVSGMAFDPTIMQEVMRASAIMQEYQAGIEQERVLDGVAETLEILADYFQDEQVPRFKQQMKQAVRRALITGVAFAKLGFQRSTGADPSLIARLADERNRLARIEQLAADTADGKFDNHSAEAEELRLSIQDLTEQLASGDKDIIMREGPVWSFPRTQKLIIDPNCYELIDFVGADWIAEEFILTREQVQQIYGKDVRGGHIRYTADGQSENKNANSSVFDPQNDKAERDGLVCVWEIYDKIDGMLYVVADGYEDFLREPKSPPVQLEQFYPYFSLSFNQLESVEELYPQSDVWLLRHIQREYNRSKEALRQHRHASRPLYVAAPGWADEEDQENLAGHNAHDVITLKNLLPGQSVNDVIQAFQKHNIDPNVYETGSVFDDFQRTVGSQEANLGGTTGATATESSIAESSRMSSLGSQADDLDDMLTAMMRAEGQLMLAEMSQETVLEIVGPGAMWPEQTASEIAKEIGLEIEAGSSGRPNQAADVQTFQQIVPLLLQIPGVVPEKLAEVGLKIMDSRFRVEDFMDKNLPSIVAMNAMVGRSAQPATGDPATDPAQQGDQGVNNAPQPDMGGALPGAGPAQPGPGLPV